MSFSNRRFVCLTVAAAFGAVVLSMPASADHSWGGYHWARTANPFTVKLGDNVNSTWDPFLATTSSDWGASDVLNTTRVAGGANPRNCRPTAGRVEVCNSTYGNTGWLGVAQIWITGGTHITQGTVKLNDTYFNTSKYNTTAWRNLVSCQEVGHTFGLDHQDENFSNANLGTCMDYTNDPSTNQHPNKHDYDELDIIYAHLDSTNTALLQAERTALSAGPPAMYLIDFDTPAQWGERVSVSRNGLVEKYELDFGDGNKVTTFVIWAEGEARPGAPTRDVNER